MEGLAMKAIPETEQSPVLRADYSDERAWDALCQAIQAPHSQYGFQAHVDFISDAEFEGIGLEPLLARLPAEYNHSFICIVDRTALFDPEHPILVVDLFTQPGRTFRVIPAELWAVENNLSIANMDFADFADAAGADGIFRGFPGAPDGFPGKLTWFQKLLLRITGFDKRKF
jgi:hypothetical protein